MTGDFMKPNPLPPCDTWLSLQAWQQTWMASLDPMGLGRHLRQHRLDHLLAHAVRESPLYAQRARRARALADVEPISKKELMLNFDAWVTDRHITRIGVEAVIAAVGGRAETWLDQYLLWTSSGTSGQLGIFVQDARSLAAFDAIESLRLRASPLGQPALAWWGAGRNFAYVGAIGGPYAGHVNMQRIKRITPALIAPQVHLISVLDPLEEIAKKLHRLQPSVLITYPSCATALAAWQTQGGLGLHLDELWLGGEQLTDTQRQALKQAYRCQLRNSYGASEFFSIASECSEGRLHLNSDWVILEGIDARGAAVPEGEFSHTTLLTNLANHVQPLLRYELTDRIRFVPEPCPCACQFPVIEVQGRSDDVLMLPSTHAGDVPLLPLVLETVIEEATGVTQFQLCCRPDGALELRLSTDTEEPARTFAQCRRALEDFFKTQGVKRQRLVHSPQPPLRQDGSGKLRRVVNLRQG